MNHHFRVVTCKWSQNREVSLSLDEVWRKPVYCPSGSRHRGDVNLIWAYVRNHGNLSLRFLRERCKQRTCKADSTDTQNRGGQVRSSDETAVIAVKRRGLVIWQYKDTNRKGRSI